MKFKQEIQNMKLFIILVLFLSVILPTQLKAEGKDVSVYIYAAEYVKEHKTVYLAKSEKEFHQIGLSTANIYGPFKTKVSDKGMLSLCQKQTAPPEIETNDGYIYPPIAEVKIPSGIKEPLLILVPNKGVMLYGVRVLERSVTDFSMGSYKFINFSSRDVRGMIGKTLATVPAQKITTFNPSNDNEADRLNVQFQYKKGESWFTFGATTWANRRDKRTLLCAYISSSTGRMKIRGIPVKEPFKVPSKN